MIARSACGGALSALASRSQLDGLWGLSCVHRWQGEQATGPGDRCLRLCPWRPGGARFGGRPCAGSGPRTWSASRTNRPLSVTSKTTCGYPFRDRGVACRQTAVRSTVWPGRSGYPSTRRQSPLLGNEPMRRRSTPQAYSQSPTVPAAQRTGSTGPSPAPEPGCAHHAPNRSSRAAGSFTDRHPGPAAPAGTADPGPRSGGCHSTNWPRICNPGAWPDRRERRSLDLPSSGEGRSG